MSMAFIQVDKPFYFAGDTIQGHVFLNLAETLNTNQIILKFKGWESVRWIEERVLSEQETQNLAHHLIWNNNIHFHIDSSDSEEVINDESSKYNYVRRGNQVIQIIRRTGGRIIARFNNVLYNFGGSYIPPGQYSFPFSFKTGEEYPASFMDKSNQSRRKGRIKYEMQAIIRGSNPFRPLIKCKNEIVIRETTAIKNEKQEMEAHVKSCCCIDQGTTRIRCFFQKNAYGPGQEARMFCVLDNKEGKAVVERVSVALINDITYTSLDNHHNHTSYRIFENNFTGLQPGQQGEREQTVKIQNLNNRTNPMDIKPTTARGKYLKSTYYLKVEAVLSASCTCCSDLPVVKQPIHIYPWIPNIQTFVPPSSWRPEEMQMVNFKMEMNAQNPRLNQMNNPYN